MVKLLDKSRTSWFNYFYIVCMLIYAGQATVFARSLGDIRTLGTTFAIFITIVFIFHNGISFSRQYGYSLLVFLLYAVISSINNGQVNPTWIIEWFIKLTMAYCICQYFGSKLFVVIETALFHLSIIALFFWFIHLVAPVFMLNMVKTFEFSTPYTEEGNVYANMLFYTVNRGTISGDVSVFAIWNVRNAGFTWEPGAFACIICLGVFCNVLRTKLSFRNNYALVIFLANLLSTQSTTGGLILIMMGTLWLFANRKFAWGGIMIPLALGLYSLPFVGGKFSEELSGLDTMDYTRITGGNLGRIYSLQLDIMEFLRHPILGLGGWTKGSWYLQQGYEFNTVSGIGCLLSQYGAIMSLLFIFLLVKSCNYIKRLTGSRSAYILIVTMLGTMFSYNLWQHPLFISFWMFGIFANRVNPASIAVKK